MRDKRHPQLPETLGCSLPSASVGVRSFHIGSGCSLAGTVPGGTGSPGYTTAWAGHLYAAVLASAAAVVVAMVAAVVVVAAERLGVSCSQRV